MPTMLRAGRFDGRTTLVTGAVGGIGEATCERIAAEGGRLVVTDLDLAASAAPATALPGDGHLAMALDVTDESAWLAVADRLRAEGATPHVETPNLLARHGGTERHAQMVAASPMGRLAAPAEVAAAIASLASPDSTYRTGSELYVDGGFTAR